MITSFFIKRRSNNNNEENSGPITAQGVEILLRGLLARLCVIFCLSCERLRQLLWYFRSPAWTFHQDKMH